MRGACATALLAVAGIASVMQVQASTDAALAPEPGMTVLAADRSLSIRFTPSADNPAGMAGTSATDAEGTREPVRIAFGSNGTADHGIQADSTYTYENVIRIRNTSSAAQTVSLGEVEGATQFTFSFSLTPYDGTRCGTVSYATSPRLDLDPGEEACLSVQIAAGPLATSTPRVTIPLSAL